MCRCTCAPDFATGEVPHALREGAAAESEDPALRAPCLEGCARSAQFARYEDSIDEKGNVEDDDRCARAREIARVGEY